MRWSKKNINISFISKYSNLSCLISFSCSFFSALVSYFVIKNMFSLHFASIILKSWRLISSIVNIYAFSLSINYRHFRPFYIPVFHYSMQFIDKFPNSSDLNLSKGILCNLCFSIRRVNYHILMFFVYLL